MNQFKNLINSAVITTKFVFNERSPILYIYHYEDGMWQFSGGEEVFEDEDYIVVSIEEILGLDSSIKELPNLSPGYHAYRKHIADAWTISEIEDN